MAKESTKCPMCGAKLKLMDGRMTCRKCGYYTRSQNAQDGTANGGAYSSSQQTGYQTTDSYSASTQSGSRSAGGYTSGQQTGSGSAPRQSASGTYTTTKSSGDSNPAVAIVTAISLGVVSLAALVGIVLFMAARKQVLPSPAGRKAVPLPEKVPPLPGSPAAGGPRMILLQAQLYPDPNSSV